ncbi:MAG TPA: GNAT family protein [Caulobacteraceae bacterium]|nr:GNAT family protein [Caulobacteraceae bacterium]
MALLDFIAPESGLKLKGEGVRLRPPRWTDYQEWASLRDGSKAFLQPWEPTWAEDDLSRGGFRRRLASYQRDIDGGAAFPFFVFREEDGRLVGGITLSNVRRGVAQMGSIGYWVGEPFAHRGYISAAVKAVAKFGFEQLGLHRIEAACLPHNEKSAQLLLKVGFEEEGFARKYLKINGEWRDHRLFGLLSPELQGR